MATIQFRKSISYLTRSLLLRPTLRNDEVENNAEISLTSYHINTDLLDSGDYGFLRELDEHFPDDSEGEHHKRQISCKATTAKTCSLLCKILFLNRAAISLWFSLFLVASGLILVAPERLLLAAANVGNATADDREMVVRSIILASRYLLNMGFIGFMSGLTNFIACLLLFYGIPSVPGCAFCFVLVFLDEYPKSDFLDGSGLILYVHQIMSRRYKEIRWIIKEVVLNLLCESEFLEKYITQELQKASANFKIEDSITSAVNSEEVELVMLSYLSEMYEEPEGYFLREIGLKQDALYLLVKPFVLMLCTEAAPMVVQELSESQHTFGSHQLRQEMDKFLSWRIEGLSKKKMRDVLFSLLFKHLDWMVMWGCIMGIFFGAAFKTIGIASL